MRGWRRNTRIECDTLSRRANTGEITKECENAGFSRLARSGFSSSPESCRFVSTAAEVRGGFGILPVSFSASGWNGRHSSVVEHKGALRGAAVMEGDLVSSEAFPARTDLRLLRTIAHGMAGSSC